MPHAEKVETIGREIAEAATRIEACARKWKHDYPSATDVSFLVAAAAFIDRSFHAISDEGFEAFLQQMRDDRRMFQRQIANSAIGAN